MAVPRRNDGPNVQALIIHRISGLAILVGSPNSGLVDGIALFTEPGKLARITQEAQDWVDSALWLVKSCRENPYGDDDEAIAGEILRHIELRKQAGKH